MGSCFLCKRYIYKKTDEVCKHNWKVKYEWNSDCSGCTATFTCVNCGDTQKAYSTNRSINTKFENYVNYVTEFIFEGQTWESSACLGYHCTTCGARVSQCGDCYGYYCPNDHFSYCDCETPLECEHYYDENCRCVYCGDTHHDTERQYAKTEPTCVESGIDIYKCIRCDHTEEVVTSATGEHSTNGNCVCETCGDKFHKTTPIGFTCAYGCHYEGLQCDVCGRTYIVGAEINADCQNGHTWNDVPEHDSDW